MAGTREIGPKTLVLELIAEYLNFSEREHAAATHRWYKNHLLSFGTSIGKLQVQSLKPFHVERWIADRYPNTKNGSTISSAMRTVQRVFNWAVQSGRLEKSPLRTLKRPAATSRDVYLMPDQYKAMLAAIPQDDAFRDFVTVMRETGCRPQEARRVEARHFDREGRCWTFPKEEAKGGREARVVLLNDRAFEITQRLALKYPEGPLFRNQRGNPWKKVALLNRCHRLREKLHFHICPYAIRHTFATDAIVRGVDLVTIAQLMGHKNLEMLQRIYQHVRKRSDHLREGLRKATEDAA
jgi:integrase